MSSGFLSAAERERWQRFPETIPQDDLAVYFLLSDDDEHEVNRQREPFNRLGYALQLCTLRYLGFVATAREKAHEETFRQLTPLLTDERKTLLDGLLQPDATTGRTLLSWLRQEAVSHAASHIIATLTKIVFLHDAGVDQWNLASLNPNRAKWLAQLGWKSTNQALQRMAPERRYPVLVAFLQQALLHHTDVTVELFDQCVWGCHSEAKQELEEFRKAMARSTNDKLKLFRELGKVLLDDDIA